MRKYINQIDEDLINLKFSQDELDIYKRLTKELLDLQSIIYTFEQDAHNRLTGSVIGKLQGIKFNYLKFGNTFYMSYEDNNHFRKWYEFWK